MLKSFQKQLVEQLWARALKGHGFSRADNRFHDLIPSSFSCEGFAADT